MCLDKCFLFFQAHFSSKNMLFNKILIVLFTLFICLPSQAQSNFDYVWLMGNPPNIPNQGYGGVKINFNTPNQEPLIQYYYVADYDLSVTLTNICNAVGEPQFQTNGCVVINNEQQKMQNGDSLNFPGQPFEDACNFNFSYGPRRSTIALPYPNKENKYIIFHQRFDFVSHPFPYYQTESLLYTTIDMEKNNGLGAVISKNQLLLNDTLCDMTSAVRHANGRDWWIVIPKFNSNQSFVLLLTPLGIETYSKEMPLAWPGDLDNFWYEQSVFSADGTKYARINGANGIQIFEFDRCNGDFYNGISLLPLPNGSTSGIAFSPNNRFLYATNGYDIYQYDTQGLDVQGSATLVASYDGFLSPLPTTFNQMQIGPNGKIYINSTNGVSSLHVIENPNVQGINCNVEQHIISLPGIIGVSLPNFPDFRLGADHNSECDTIVTNSNSLDKQVINIYIQPNPASEYFNLNFIPSSLLLNVDLFNSCGQKVLHLESAKNGDIINISNLPVGLYFITFFDSNKTILTKKIAINRQ